MPAARIEINQKVKGCDFNGSPTIIHPVYIIVGTFVGVVIVGAGAGRNSPGVSPQVVVVLLLLQGTITFI
jgi:hypothetical protein